MRRVMHRKSHPTPPELACDSTIGRSADMTIAVPRTGYASVNGLEMYYVIQGTPHADIPPLLILHGALATLDMFGELRPALAQSREVIAIEQQGHGRTADIDRPLSYAQMADDTAALVRQLGINQVDIFG